MGLSDANISTIVCNASSMQNKLNKILKKTATCREYKEQNENTDNETS